MCSNYSRYLQRGWEKDVRSPVLGALRTDERIQEWSLGWVGSENRLWNGEQSFWPSVVAVLHTVPSHQGSHLKLAYTFWDRLRMQSLQRNPGMHPRCQMYSCLFFQLSFLGCKKPELFFPISTEQVLCKNLRFIFHCNPLKDFFFLFFPFNFHFLQSWK